LGSQIAALDLVEILRDFRARQIDQPVVARARLDITIATRDVAQAAGVEPQRLEAIERNARAGLAAGGAQWILEFRRSQRRDIVARGIGPGLLRADDAQPAARSRRLARRRPQHMALPE